MVAIKDASNQNRALSPLEQWNELGKTLLEQGVALDAAITAAQQATRGAETFSHDEVDRIAAWFVGEAREAICRGGIDALWMLLSVDSISPRTQVCRSSVFEDLAMSNDAVGVDRSGGRLAYEEQFLRGCDHYIRVLLAGVEEHEAKEVREVFNARGAALDSYAPFCHDRDTPDGPPEGHLMDCAVSAARAKTNKAVSDVVAEYAYWMRERAREATMTPAYRIGLVSWMARRGLKRPRGHREQTVTSSEVSL